MEKLKQIILLHGFAKSLSPHDLVAQQRFRLFKIGAVSTFIVLVVFLVQVYMMSPGKFFVLGFMLLLFIAVFLNYFLLAIHKNQKAAYGILVMIWLCLLHVDSYYSGGVRNAAHFYLPTIVLAAYMLLGKKGGLLVAFFSVLHVAYFYFIGVHTNWVIDKLSTKDRSVTDAYFLLCTAISLLSLNAQASFLQKSKDGIIRDIESKRKELEEKNAELEKLSLVASQTRNGVIITNTEGSIEWMNEGFSRITGFSFGEVIGKNFADLFSDKEVLIQAKAYMRNPIKGKEPFKCQLVNYTKRGRQYCMEFEMQPMFTGAGKAERFFAILNDITEKAALEQMILEEKISVQKEMAKAIIATQEKERSEIGKELHDNVNQILTTSKLYVENIAYYPDQSEQYISKSRELIQKSINEIRFLSRALVTPVIRDIGFKETLLELIDAYKDVHVFSIEHNFQFQEERIDKGIKLTIYRILQEELNNAVKYARASLVKLKVEQKQDRLILAYADDGVGFDPARKKSGLGLNNIKNRAEVYRGHVDIDSSPGNGCRIEVSFPM